MKWMKFKIKTVVEAEDIIISELYDRGLEGAQIEDKVPLSPLEKEQMFVDILPESEADDGTAYLSFFVEENADGSLHLSGEAENADDAFDFGGESGNGGAPGTGPENGTAADKETVLARIEEALAEVRQFIEIGEGTVTVSETEDIDWINNWKQYFHQFYIDDLLVIPSWETVKEEDQNKKILHIDPGTAFGTGMHETTRLCIRQIKKYVTPETAFLYSLRRLKFRIRKRLQKSASENIVFHNPQIAGVGNVHHIILVNEHILRRVQPQVCDGLLGQIGVLGTDGIHLVIMGVGIAGSLGSLYADGFRQAQRHAHDGQ